MEFGKKLPIMEEFLSVQGEGANAGQVAWFIRLAGCDVGCTWCDVKDSWDKDLHPVKTVEELVENAVNSGAKNIVVTGGEPALYPLDELSSSLQKNGMKTWIETSGSSPITGFWDWICLSPKKFKAALPESLAMAHELKVVVLNKNDISWGEAFVSQLNNDCKLYFQPEWDKREKASSLIFDYVTKNPQWRVSVQTHKYLDIR